MRKLRSVAPDSELLAKVVPDIRLAGLAARQEREMFARRRVYDRAQVRMHRNIEDSAGLLLPQMQDTVAAEENKE